MFDTLAAVQPHVKTGALKALAVTTAKRVPSVADLPTMAEAGLPGYETSTWGGVLAPAGTPKDVVAKLNAEFNAGLAQPDIKKKINDAGIETGRRHAGAVRGLHPGGDEEVGEGGEGRQHPARVTTVTSARTRERAIATPRRRS